MYTVYFEKVFMFCENKLPSFFTFMGLFLVFINYVPYQHVQPDRRYTLQIDSNVRDSSQLLTNGQTVP
jgi:hypothetical protein